MKKVEEFPGLNTPAVGIRAGSRCHVGEAAERLQGAPRPQLTVRREQLSVP